MRAQVERLKRRGSILDVVMGQSKDSINGLRPLIGSELISMKQRFAVWNYD